MPRSSAPRRRPSRLRRTEGGTAGRRAATHLRPALRADLYYLPRGDNPFGDVLSSVRDQINHFRFHIGDGRGRDGSRVMSRAALRGMWANPGQGGMLMVELTGMGVSWAIRPTAEGVTVVQHGGDPTG